MIRTTWEERRRLESLDSASLAEHQLGKLNALLELVLPHNRFYAEKLAGIDLPLRTLDDLAALPFTFKEELVSGSHEGEFAANLTYPLHHYVRYHRTSGTHGRPMVVLDTAQDWLWWIDTWQFILDAVEISPSDRALTAFSFGPFIGFWSAHEACVARGALVVPSGGMSSLARLELMKSCKATVIFSTPSYCLHLAEVATENHLQLASLDVRKIIVAGEPGGSVPAVRERIESLWRAKVIDHAGASEVGPWGVADAAQRGMQVIEAEFIAEFLSLETGRPAAEGELAELVLTTLGRAGSPVIRYRTGDLVRPTWNAAGPCRFVLLEGGVLGRTDDMIVVRAVNIFPSSIDQILRSFPEVVEYRATVSRQGELDSLQVEIEDRLGEPARVAKELQLRLGLKIEVSCVPLGTLPRFEGKGKRMVDLRKKEPTP